MGTFHKQSLGKEIVSTMQQAKSRLWGMPFPLIRVRTQAPELSLTP